MEHSDDLGAGLPIDPVTQTSEENLEAPVVIDNPSTSSHSTAATAVFEQTPGCQSEAPAEETPHVPITVISPIPKRQSTDNDKKRARGHTAVLTSSPYKKMLEIQKQKLDKRSVKSTRKKQDRRGEITAPEERNNVTESTPKSAIKKRGRKRPVTTTADDIVTTGKTSKRKSRRQIYKTNRAAGADPDCDVPCLYCQEKFSHSLPENWVQCTVCHSWAHVACSGINDDQESYICEICL